MKTHLRYLFGLMLALGLFAATLSPARAFIGVTVGIAPPPLPVYVQPACPGDGYAWTPGYWAWDPDVDSYYWVPGSWVLAPEVGLLWTPCWWGWQDNAYCFHRGYWGRDVGFYGGINYGYGYNGRGFDGGRWHGNHFVVSRSANSFNGSRVSFNGGRGGTNAVASADERRAAGEHHFAATNAQNAQVRSAAADPTQRFSSNHGNPRVTSATRAGSLRGTGATHQRATGESAFTGESRTASSEHANRTSSGNAFTGENRSASRERERTAQASAQHGSQVAAEQRHTEAQRTASVERHSSAQHVREPRVSESHVSMPNRTESFHPSVSHSSGGGGGGGGFSHASVSHSGGGGGGFAHASASHSGGGGGGGGSHGGGGGGGHH